jgi:hypothetical protein
MAEEGSPNSVPSETTPLVLEKASIDWQSTQTQMVAGLFAIVLLCFALYWTLVAVPFVPESSTAVNDALKALSGDNSSFITDLQGGISDPVYGFRPLFYVGVFAQAVLFRAAPAGYHLVNIFLLCADSTFLSLTVLEVTGRYGNRLGACPAIWSGILFAVYPLNSTSISEIDGFQLLLGSGLSLACIFAFLRYRLLRESGYLIASLACFVAAVLTWESAILLPCVLTATMLLPPEPPGPKTKLDWWQRTIELTGPYWSFSVLYALPRPEWLQNFVRVALHGPLPDANELARTIWKLVLYPPDLNAVPTIAALGVAAGILIVRMVVAQASFNAIAFFLLWIFLFLLQPNPNWSAAAIAPICALLVMLTLPAVDRMGKALAALYATAGSQMLLVLLCYWAFKMLNQ